MPGQLSNSIAVVAALLLVSTSVELRTSTARAEDCHAAPNASAPQGQHWYYRIDRPDRRKCWYLHATITLPNRPAKRAELHSVSTAVGVPISRSLAESAPLLPRTPTLAVELQPTLIVSAAPAEPIQQSAPQRGDPFSIPLASGADSVGRDADAHTSHDARSDQNSSPTIKADMAGALSLALLLLVPGFAIAGFLISVVVKIAAARRIPFPGAARMDYQFYRERPDAEAQRQQADRPHGLGFGDPGSRRKFVDQQYGIGEPAPAQTLHSTPRSRNIAATSVTSRRNEDIERALHVIRHGVTTSMG